jgi:small ligand-binding sensory domain FIST
LTGCNGFAGVLGTSEDDGSPEEFEDFKGVTVSAAYLPGVEINTFRIKSKQMPSSGLGTTQDEWRNLVGSPPVDKKPCMVLLGGQDFSARGNLGSLVEGLDFAYSESVKVGGISSGQIPGGVWCSGEGGGLFGPDESCNDGDAVGMCMWGNIECEPIVAQGCRPIGDMYEVSLEARDILRLCKNTCPPRATFCTQTQTKTDRRTDRQTDTHTHFLPMPRPPPPRGG